MIGKVIQHFEILRELGHGGMGKVFEANDQMLDRRVAIKVLHPDMDQDPNLVQRFQKEAKALGRLKHPNVTSVFSFFRSEDQFFLVMELVPGERLDELLQRRSLLPWEEAVGIACAVLDGLAHAHDQGLLHRDVKAGNCLITPEGEVKLSDFGIAQVVGGTRLTRQGGVVGTPEYMSPEQIQGKPLDARTDIYSLGIVLYEMVAGRAPFRSESTYEVMRAQIEMLPTPPRALRLEIPPWLEMVILKSLAKDPEQRFSSAAEFATFLRQGCAPSTGPSGIDTGINTGTNTGTNTGIDGGAQTTVLEPPPPALRPTTPLPRTVPTESPTVARETGKTV
jgi:serine/threonine-protein kinase